MPDRAPKAHRHARLGGHMAHVLAGKTIGQIEQAFGCGFVGHVDGARQVGRGPRHPARRDGIACRLDAQAADSALLIDRRLELGQVHGAVKVVTHVFFS